MSKRKPGSFSWVRVWLSFCNLPDNAFVQKVVQVIKKALNA